MTKSEVKALFGGTEQKVAEHTGRTQPAINMWRDPLPIDTRIIVIGAASIFGIKIPKQWKDDLKRDLLLKGVA